VFPLGAEPGLAPPGVGGTGRCGAGAGGRRGGRRRGGGKEPVLCSKVRAACEGWAVSPAVGSRVEQGPCVGFAVKPRGSKADLLSVSPRAFECPWLVLALRRAPACHSLPSLPEATPGRVKEPVPMDEKNHPATFQMFAYLFVRCPSA